MRTGKEIRDGFRQFFVRHGHEPVASGPLVPPNDPSLMFSNAGMVQFKDVFTGQQSRPAKRATTAQKCVRISGKHNDLENVGVTARHHTFFEMLGNFSFGDYFKQEAIALAWELMTEGLGLPPDRLVVSIFGGDQGLEPDHESAAIWREVAGLPEERILRCGAKDNFWQMGDTGPCGPCSEIHYFQGEGLPDPATLGHEPRPDGSGWVELWNLVFMQFERHAKATLRPLPAPSIDTGAGLERLAAAAQGVLSNYDTDLLRPIVDLASEIAGKPYRGTLAADDISMRVIADHARMTSCLISEGVLPDRDGRAYVLRRVMRRAIRHGHRLGIERLFLHECALKAVDLLCMEYPELDEQRALVAQISEQEEERFRATLRRGLERLESHTTGKKPGHTLPGSLAFELYDTYGFPLDLQEVIGHEQGFSVDREGFERALGAARERSAGSKVGEQAVAAVYRNLSSGLGRVEFVGYEREQAESRIASLLCDGSEVQLLAKGQSGELVTKLTPFYAEAGGQVGDRGTITSAQGLFEVSDTQAPLPGLIVHRGRVSDGTFAPGQQVRLAVDHARRSATRRNHSATHLMHWALRTVLGPQAVQKGSLVGPDRLRFDYTASRPLAAEQIGEIEDLVNERVLCNAPAATEVLPLAQAKERGAIGIFEEKYGSVVRMLTLAESIELCGGTHVERTGDIGLFKILSDTGLAAGVRRIEAVTGTGAMAHLRRLERELSETARLVKSNLLDTSDKVGRMLQRHREQQHEVKELKRQLVAGGRRDLSSQARKVGAITVLGASVDVGDARALRELADKLRNKLEPAVVALGSPTKDGRAILVCTVSKPLTVRYQAGKLVRQLAEVVGGAGGGRPDFAQAGGSNPAKLEQAVQRVYSLIASPEAEVG
ncbi:MAG: alanine--tRNA ligase [Proteobacteria bacterium]|nr:alanine--tRNA ligase [Pseudomonadota bacterium]